MNVTGQMEAAVSAYLLLLIVAPLTALWNVLVIATGALLIWWLYRKADDE